MSYRRTDAAQASTTGWSRLSELMRQFVSDAPGLEEAMAARIRSAVPAYAEGSAFPSSALLASCASHVAFIRGAGTEAGENGPHAIGADRARAGVPLATVLSAYRVGAQVIWEQLAAYARRSGDADVDDLVELASETWLMHDEFASAMERGWLDAEQSRLIRAHRERASVVDSIVRSTTESPSHLWEAVDRLGLPRVGDFVIVVVRVEQLGVDPLPGVERRLERQQVASAWLLRSEMLVGVVLMTAPNADAALHSLLVEAGATCGISPVRDDYAQGAQAFRFAAAAAAASPTGRTTRFADVPMAVVVAAAPDVAREVSAGVLSGVLALPEEERSTMLETIRAWFEADGSTADTAAALYLHPNSVRNRLKRWEALTSRSLSSPAHIAEIALALGSLALR
ncbi:PucR family transcriptional regulator [Amnibacterium kyonggiense]